MAESFTELIENTSTKVMEPGMQYFALLRLLRLPKETAVQQFKRLFGKQDGVYFNGEFKFWVWRRDGHLIFVNNTKGVSIERIE